jgi:hypothetical protein
VSCKKYELRTRHEDIYLIPIYLMGSVLVTILYIYMVVFFCLSSFYVFRLPIALFLSVIILCLATAHCCFLSVIVLCLATAHWFFCVCRRTVSCDCPLLFFCLSSFCVLRLSNLFSLSVIVLYLATVHCFVVFLGCVPCDCSLICFLSSFCIL